MNKIILTILFFIIAGWVYTQKPISIRGSVFDADSGEPVAETHVFIKGHDSGTITNAYGKYSIDLTKIGDTLVYSHLLYDTVHVIYSGTNLNANILFEPKEYMLPDATVRPVINVSKGMLLDVTDYIFVGDSILYSGFCYRYKRKQNPWLVMIAPNGDTVFTHCTGMEGRFFKDCFENIHYLTDDMAYQLVFSDNGVSLEHPTEINEFLTVMSDCKFVSDGKIVFSQFSDRNQLLVYYLADTVTYETEVFRTIADEVKLNMLAFQGLFFSMGPPPNEHDLRFEEMMYNPVFAPIIKSKDTISIFNYTDGKIEMYDTCFNRLGSSDVYFQNSRYCEDELLVDNTTNRVYAVFEKSGKMSVKEIFVNSGTTGKELAIPNFFWVDNMKIHNGQLYFLFREKYTGDLRSLYKMFLD